MAAERKAIESPVAGEKPENIGCEHSSLLGFTPADVPLTRRLCLALLSALWVHLCDLWVIRRVAVSRTVGSFVSSCLRRGWLGGLCDLSAYVFLWFFESDGSSGDLDAAILAGMAEGYFITFEGGEGTGKSTQLLLIRDWLKILGHSIVVTREPGGTNLAEAVRSLLLDPELEPDGVSEIFLLEAARRDHIEKVVRPALAEGSVVLCDRFTDSSLVYQGLVRGLGWEEGAGLNRLATGGLEPDLTLVFDMDPMEALARAHNRNSEKSSRENRLDDEPAEFHLRVRDGFLELAEREPGRVQVIAADGSPEEVFARVYPILPEALR